MKICLKSFFLLPPEAKRIRGKTLFSKFTLASDSVIKDPDFYIIYRAGVSSNFLAAILTTIAYIVSYLNYSYQFFPYLKKCC